MKKFDTRSGSWMGAVTSRGKRHRVFAFASKEEAALAVMALREKLHGEFSNHGAN